MEGLIPELFLMKKMLMKPRMSIEMAPNLQAEMT